MPAYSPNFSYVGIRWLKRQGVTAALPSAVPFRQVSLSDFSFVCLCAQYLEKLWTDLDEIWWAGWVCDNDELFRFW